MLLEFSEVQILGEEESSAFPLFRCESGITEIPFRHASLFEILSFSRDDHFSSGKLSFDSVSINLAGKDSLPLFSLSLEMKNIFSAQFVFYFDFSSKEKTELVKKSLLDAISSLKSIPSGSDSEKMSKVRLLFEILEKFEPFYCLIDLYVEANSQSYQLIQPVLRSCNCPVLVLQRKPFIPAQPVSSQQKTVPVTVITIG